MNRRKLGPVDALSGPAIARIGRMVFGALLTAVAVSLAAFMAVALLHEIVLGDFFGAAVSALVLTFGTQLAKIGCQQMVKGRKATSAEQHPTGGLRQLDTRTRVFHHLPHSRSEIRRR